MTKSQFLSVLKTVVTFRATKKTAPCRCVGCCNERQRRQGKIGDIVLK